MTTKTRRPLRARGARLLLLRGWIEGLHLSARQTWRFLRTRSNLGAPTRTTRHIPTAADLAPPSHPQLHNVRVSYDFLPRTPDSEPTELNPPRLMRTRPVLFFRVPHA